MNRSVSSNQLLRRINERQLPRGNSLSLLRKRDNHYEFSEYGFKPEADINLIFC